MSEFFEGVPKIQFGGPRSRNPLEFKHYNPDEVVGGKTMKDHLRFSVVYWHTIANPLGDPFGPGTAIRPWDEGTDGMDRARTRVKVAFDTSSDAAESQRISSFSQCHPSPPHGEFA